MKKMWKKPLALLLAVMMLVTAAPLTFADGGFYCETCGVERSLAEIETITAEKEAESCKPKDFGYALKPGYTSGTAYVCKVCGDVLHGDFVKYTKQHTINEPEVQESSVQTIGDETVHGMKAHYKCDICGGYFKKEMNVFVPVAEEELLIHDWKEYNVTAEETHIASAATCKVLAQYYKKCSICGKYADEVADAAEEVFGGGELLTHDFGDWVETTPAQCGVAGEKTRTCKREGCGFEEKQPIDALEHDALDTLEWVVINPETEAVIENAQPNCNAGFTRAKICSKCKAVLDKETIPAGTDHQTVMVREKKATCLEDGVKAPGGFYCTVCSYKKAWEVDPAVGHHTEALQEGKAATCFEDGYEAYWICSVCKEKLTEKVVIPKLDHDLTKVDAVEPHDGQPGTKEYWTCKNDCCEGKKFIVKLDEEGNPVEEDGKTVYVEATDADLIYDCPHDWDKIEPDEDESVAVTCTVDGKEVKICPVCGERKETVLKAPGHDLEGVEFTHEREPKCNTDGYYYKACKRCGEKVEEKFPQKTGQHNWETKDEYDCTKNTKITYICTICNESKVEQKAASPDGKHPDADDNGYCDLCGKQFCVCLCHNQEWYGKILYFFARVWWEFLSIRDTCACGKVHYEKNISIPTA